MPEYSSSRIASAIAVGSVEPAALIASTVRSIESYASATA
jgi:hypothetical protein